MSDITKYLSGLREGIEEIIENAQYNYTDPTQKVVNYCRSRLTRALNRERKLIHRRLIEKTAQLEAMVDNFNLVQDERKKLQSQLALAREGLRVSANQLEGVSVAIKAHGQNINVAFFIETYLEMADDKREILAQLDKKDDE